MIKLIRRTTDKKYLQSLELGSWTDNVSEAFEMTYRECEDVKANLLESYETGQITEIVSFGKHKTISSEEKQDLLNMLSTSYNVFLSRLGRVEKRDERDLNYLISDKLPITQSTPKITSKYWQDDLWWGNQGSTPQCVGYAWAHWIDDGPVTHGGPYPSINPSVIYTEAQKLDEWVGENYDGTSVRGGAKYLKAAGKIRSYLWAFNVTTLVNTVLSIGPVVVGTNWYTGMFYPDRNGLIRVSGRLAGGHAYQINGVDTITQRFRIKNSWGQSWGQQGHAFISFTDMARLIKEGGEICLAVENSF